MKLRELAAYVSEKEGQLAYGSETCLLTGFVNDFGYIDEAIESDRDIDPEYMQIWVDAYNKYEELEKSGADFCINDCF